MKSFVRKCVCNLPINTRSFGPLFAKDKVLKQPLKVSYKMINSLNCIPVAEGRLKKIFHFRRNRGKLRMTCDCIMFVRMYIAAIDGRIKLANKSFLYYIRKIPNLVWAMGALRLALKLSPRISRVCLGSMTPSSQSRALEK